MFSQQSTFTGVKMSLKAEKIVQMAYDVKEKKVSSDEMSASAIGTLRRVVWTTITKIHRRTAASHHLLSAVQPRDDDFERKHGLSLTT